MPLKEKSMNLAAKLKKVADAARGQKGTYSLNIVHADNCPARSTGNIIACNCDFKVIVNTLNSDKTVNGKAEKQSKRDKESLA